MTYEFGPFRYDAELKVLYRGGELVPLVPEAADTLHALLERRGQVVEEAELPNISLLRQALGNGENLYIETIAGRGYQFAARVDVVQPRPPLGAARWEWRWLAVPVVLIAFNAFLYFQFYVPSRYGPKLHSGASLAVVPFNCVCPPGSTAAELFAAALDELLVAELSKAGTLQVMAPSTVRRHQKAGVSTGLMGRLLDLDVLIEGTVQKMDGEHLRITARLVDVHTGRVIWSNTFERTAASQRAVSQAIATAVRARLK